MATILIKRGLQTDISNLTLAEGELALAYNADKTAVALYAGDGNGGIVLINPDVTDDITGVLTQAKGYTDTKIGELVNGAPEAMDTLKELADAIAANSSLMDALNAAIGSKVDKVDGMGLSSNDYTTEEKTKLAGIETGANKTVVDTALSSTSTNPVQNKVVNAALAEKLDTNSTIDGGTF